MIEIAGYFTERIENVEQVDIKGAGHLSNMEKPEEFNRMIKEFIKDN